MKLKDWLKYKNITAHKFAKQVKIPFQSLYKYTHGQPPRIDKGVKIFQATGGLVTLSDLGITDCSPRARAKYKKYLHPKKKSSQ